MTAQVACSASRRVDLPTEADTERLARALAERLRDGPDDIRRLWLSGELGAGKTTLARALLRALGVSGQVRSPTFAIVERYDLSLGGEVRLLCHVDLYRLSHPRQIVELGLMDELDGGALLVIEWPENGAEALGPPDVSVNLEYAAEGRRAELSTSRPEWQDWISELSLSSQ